MGMIYRELKQAEPFERLEEEAFVTILRTSDVLRSAMERIFRAREFSIEQYDILRALRRAPGGCLPTLEIAGRILSRAPNITRLVDKLARKGLVARRRERGDRRVVTVRITEEGRRLFAECTAPARAEVLRRLGVLDRSRLRNLIGALDAVRAAGPP